MIVGFCLLLHLFEVALAERVEESSRKALTKQGRSFSEWYYVFSLKDQGYDVIPRGRSIRVGRQRILILLSL